MIGKNLGLDDKLTSGQYKGKLVRQVLFIDPVYLSVNERNGEMTFLSDVTRVLDRVRRSKADSLRKDKELVNSENELVVIQEELKIIEEKSLKLKEEIDIAEKSFIGIKAEGEAKLEDASLSTEEVESIKNGIIGAETSLNALKEQLELIEAREITLIKEQKVAEKKAKEEAKKAKKNK